MPWESVECHPIVRENVQRAVSRGRLGSTLLFYGSAGAGQYPIALALAQTLLCPQREEDFCGECSTCQRIQQKLFPDVIELTPRTSVYAIDQLREMQQQAFYQPYEGNLKVFLLHDAHRMQNVAANSLLKCLEEPAPYARFFLLTDSVEELLPTIRSRCWPVRLRPLSTENLRQQLGDQFPGDAATTLARAAGGLPQLARQLVDEEYLNQRDEMLQLLQRLQERESAVVEEANRLAKSKQQAREGLAILLNLSRDGLCCASQMEKKHFLNPDRQHEIHQLWGQSGTANIMKAMDHIIGSLEEMNRNTNLTLVLIDVFLCLRPSLQSHK